MESETPADVRIFFKDKQNELKGPYTEREVQDWYRQNWFDSSFPFYYMTGDERPTEQTEFRTLDTLRTLNGVGCPFAPFKPESNSEKIDEKMAKLEKELADLSKKCDGMKELEKRLEDVENRLKELSTQPPPTSTSSAATDGVIELEKRWEDMEKRLKELTTEPPPTSSSSAAATAPVAVKALAVATSTKKQEQPENSEHAKLANDWAAFYLDVLEAYNTNNWFKVIEEKKKQLLLLNSPDFYTEPLRKKCREVLLKKLVELDYFYCSECNAIFHNFKQILLHVCAKKHQQESDALQVLQKAVNMMMTEIFRPLLERLKTIEDKHTMEVLEKHRHVNSLIPGFRPLLGFVEHLTAAYGDAIFDYRSIVRLNRAQIVAKMVPRLKQNDQLGREMMSELHEHIGDTQTRCFHCKVVTGTREQYYQHQRTLSHLTKSHAMDIITLLVNLHQKDCG